MDVPLPNPFLKNDCEGCREGYANQQAHSCLDTYFQDGFDYEGDQKEDVEMEDANVCPGDGSCLTLCDRKGDHARCEVLVGKVNDPMSCYCNTFSGCESTLCNLVPCKLCGTGHPRWFISINGGVCTICNVERPTKKRR